MRPLFIDCPPFLMELYREGLGHIVPDLEIEVGDPAPAELPALVAGRSLIMNDHTRLDAATLRACPTLEAIVFLGTGAGSFIDLEAAAARGIAVRAYKGYGDRSVAEHAMALMFAAARQLAAMDAGVRAGRWETRNGVELLGKTLGVIGTGGIGAEMARMAAGIGMKVLAWSRSGVRAGLPCAEVPLDELLSVADVVSLHLVLNDETRGFLGRGRLGRLRRGAIFVNTARGAIVDEAALVEALEEKRIGHAALDVFAEEPLPAGHPLTTLPNVTLTAHAAFMTREASINLLRMALELVVEERARLEAAKA
jgi:D-3-phosphoglycerate dehydrogenase